MNSFLDIINDVLIELREVTVDSVTGDEYAELIGRFVNRALVQVEDAHDWRALYDTYDLTTDPGVTKYSLTNQGNRVKIDFIVDQQNQRVLQESSRRWITLRNQQGLLGEGRPTHWCNDGVDSNGDAAISVYTTPADNYDYYVNGWFKSPELILETDMVVVPKQPVVDLALAFAARERGEVGGTTAAEYFELAKRSLSDAIDIDKARNDEEFDWYVV